MLFKEKTIDFYFYFSHLRYMYNYRLYGRFRVHRKQSDYNEQQLKYNKLLSELNDLEYRFCCLRKEMIENNPTNTKVFIKE